MKLLVGLGNPGTRYAGTRHNIGFMAVDRLAEGFGLGPWKQRFQGLAADGAIAGHRVLLLKPQTYMNESGRSVAEAARFLKIEPADIVVFHDEIDLAPGKLKVKTGGGHAGHNGLRSIQQHLSPDHVRVRMGVGHPGHKDAVAGYVLHDFWKSELGWLDDMLRGIEDGAPQLLGGDLPGFQTKVALRLSPPRSGGPKPEAPERASASSTPTATTSPGPTPAATPTGDAATAHGPADPDRPGSTPPPTPPDPDSRSPLQRLADRFR